MNTQRVSKTEVEESFLERTLEEADIGREELPESLTEALLVYIARVSSSRQNRWEDHAGLIRYLIEKEHWSPFEHAFITYEIETSRAIGRQLLRHRSFTFQEFSQRYQEVAEFEDFELRGEPEVNRQSSSQRLSEIKQNGNQTILNWGSLDSAQANGTEDAAIALEAIEDAYQRLIDSGVASETARMILPGATTTTIYMSGPLRSWIHFLDIRADSHAQKEIREIAQEIKDDLSDLFPHVANAAFH